MGLFDEVKCEAELPAEPPPPKERWFQTKDTECPYLEKYTITKEGRLIHHVVRYDIDPPDKAVGPKDTNWNGDFGFGHYDTETREHWEYVAHFIEGQLCRIWLAAHTPADSVGAA